jgi:hypothetical protein
MVVLCWSKIVPDTTIYKIIERTNFMSCKVDDIIYIAIKLDDESHQKVAKIASPTLPFCKSEYKLYADHITLAFGDDAKKPQILHQIGLNVKALAPFRVLTSVIGAGVFFEKKQLEMRGIPFYGQKVHCTVCLLDGVPPVRMGDITETNHYVMIADPTQHVSGQIMAFAKDGKWHNYVTA